MRYAEIENLYNLPFFELLQKARRTHEEHWTDSSVQLCTLLSIKTGGCSEDCSYCAQSARYSSGVTAERLMEKEQVMDRARAAKQNGSTRFCMGAAWRQPKQKDLDSVVSMIKVIKDMNMESCVTLGMLSSDQARQLKDAGLDYYNHNIDSSPEYYTKIISTRDYNERLATLDNVREAGISVCCGGIIGMGESSEDRAGFLLTLANMPSHPESVPINMLVKVEGTPLNDAETADPIEFVRIIAAARIMMPRSYIRLSAGRNDMSDEMQALCYLAGANSIFYGEKVINGSIIISYSDILFEPSVVKRLMESDHDISVVVDIDWRGYYVGRKHHPISEAENVIFNSNNEVKKIGKYKDWEAMVVMDADGKVCFAQSLPILQAPKTNKRDAKLFVAFRPNESITNEVSVTPGYEFNKSNSVTAASGKNKFKFPGKKEVIFKSKKE